MNYPQELTQAEAKALASPQDTHAMRIIVRRVANQALYRLSGKRRRYVLEYCPKMNVHFIDVPFSVWADGIDLGRPYEDNFSVAHDIQANQQFAESLVVFPVPFGAAAPVDLDPEKDVFTPLENLLDRMCAPQIVIDAIKLAKGGREKELRGLVALHVLESTMDDCDHPATACRIPDPEPISDPETPPLPDAAEPMPSDAAERMRKMREAKAAKKAAASIM